VCEAADCWIAGMLKSWKALLFQIKRGGDTALNWLVGRLELWISWPEALQGSVGNTDINRQVNLGNFGNTSITSTSSTLNYKIF